MVTKEAQWKFQIFFSFSVLVDKNQVLIIFNI